MSSSIAFLDLSSLSFCVSFLVFVDFFGASSSFEEDSEDDDDEEEEEDDEESESEDEEELLEDDCFRIFLGFASANLVLDTEGEFVNTSKLVEDPTISCGCLLPMQ